MKKPSVTQLIALLDKPALLNWANQQGLKGIDISKERKNWLSAGTSIHNQIEKFLLEGIPFEDKKDEERFLGFIEDKDILAIENKVETEWFTGIFDVKLDWKGKRYLMDYKRNAKKVYLEHKLQLVAYSMAEQCDGFAIVSVPSFEVFEFEIENREPYIEIIKALSSIYQYKKLID